ncbi:hypothetical protein KP509_32G061200 [Ceratopteris richardii]|uniref:K Homology domain-containing protein n=1 Tax=Ceratopteris richardii TaxID=49495 RepID=A0A8T2QVU6_CERRI|nr:hypothetical protein KP509_32G061200 [Ceratopteris richardii]KAH7287541.1 hypothetical protein KP509_32G061200 [Ceratopteris richardii]
MSALQLGKRPLSDIAREAEANGRFNKRRAPPPRPSSPAPASVLAPFKPGETVFKLLCPAAKTGSIIGKGGSIIKSIRQDTGAMIRIEDAVFGCDERVVIISIKEDVSLPQKPQGTGGTEQSVEQVAEGKSADSKEDGEKQVKRGTNDKLESGEENGKDGNAREEEGSGSEFKEEEISPVQEALLRAHLRVLEADAKPGETISPENLKDIVTRLLVPTSQVGCLIGKQGKIVSRMREESGAQIRVLPKDQVPPCASALEEVVQITGDFAAVKKALISVSTQLRNNPPKKPADLSEAAGFHHLSEASMPKAGGLMVSKPLATSLSPVHTLGQSSGLTFPYGKEEVTFRMMCPKEKVGAIIGKGGSIVQRLCQETGAKISIDVSAESGDERVIRITAHESAEDVFSKAQRAVMMIHSRMLTTEQDKEGLVTTRLLVPADQAGCLLGKGGSIVIEMRKLTRAKIHIFGKEHLPSCALKTDELVEIVGSHTASQDALTQITTRLRNNLFRGMPGPGSTDAKLSPYSTLSSVTEGPLSLRTSILPSSAAYGKYRSPYQDILTDVSGSYLTGQWPSQSISSFSQDVRSKTLPDVLGLGHTRELGGESRRPTAAFITSQTVEVIVPEHAINSIMGESGSNLQQICKISGARVRINGVAPGGFERVVEISGTPDQTHAAQSLLQAFILSGQ